MTRTGNTDYCTRAGAAVLHPEREAVAIAVRNGVRFGVCGSCALEVLEGGAVVTDLAFPFATIDTQEVSA